MFSIVNLRKCHYFAMSSNEQSHLAQELEFRICATSPQPTRRFSHPCSCSMCLD